ncbi:MAG: S1C family serine protease [Candidatus Dormibacteria bacterium]
MTKLSDQPPAEGGDQGEQAGEPPAAEQPSPAPLDWSSAEPVEPLAPAPRPSRRSWFWVGGAAAAAALAGGGYGIGLLVSSNSPGNQAIPKPAATSSSSPSRLGSVNASRIASQLDPATVDITAIDGDQGATSAGTGMILTPNGEVLTNNHVIDGGTSITARVDGTGPKYQVKVLGFDAQDDVALVQLVGASGLPTVTVGNSATVKVGDRVVAIGNALDLPGKPTVTSGAISALDRTITATDQGSGSSEQLNGMFQTDAPLQSGDSGGPLVNAQGQVIGMDTANEQSAQTASSSTVGFAIPINRALSLASQIQRGDGSSKIHIGLPAFLGVDVVDASSASQSNPFAQFGGGGQGYTPPVNTGALVVQVVANTPAQAAGLQPGDVITAVDGASVSGQAELRSDFYADKPGQTVSLTWVDSSGQSHTSSVTLITGPAG